MEDRETPQIHKYGESKTTQIMMATVSHVTSNSGLRKFQADGLLFDSVYKYHIMFWTNIAWCNVAAICTTSELHFLLPCLMKQVTGYNTTKSCKSFWNTKCCEFYIYRWIYSQHNCPRYTQLSITKMKQTSQLHLPLNMTNSNNYCFSQHTWCS